MSFVCRCCSAEEWPAGEALKSQGKTQHIPRGEFQGSNGVST